MPPSSGSDIQVNPGHTGPDPRSGSGPAGPGTGPVFGDVAGPRPVPKMPDSENRPERTRSVKV